MDEDITDCPALPPRRFSKPRERNPATNVLLSNSHPPPPPSRLPQPPRSTTATPPSTLPTRSTPRSTTTTPPSSRTPLPDPPPLQTLGEDTNRRQLTRDGYEELQIPHVNGTNSNRGENLKVSRNKEKGKQRKREDKEEVIIIQSVVAPSGVVSPIRTLPQHSICSDLEDNLTKTMSSDTNNLSSAYTIKVSSAITNTRPSACHEIVIRTNDCLKPVESASEFIPIITELPELSPRPRAPSHAKLYTMSVEALQQVLLNVGLCDKAAIFSQRCVDGEMFLAMSDKMLLNEPFSLTNFEMLQITRLRNVRKDD